MRLEPLHYVNPLNPRNWTWGLRAFVFGFFAALGAISYMVGYCSTGCARPDPQTPQQQHEIDAVLHCFLVESVGGNGLVCTERASPCKTIHGMTAVMADGVTAISECRRAMVTVDAKE